MFSCEEIVRITKGRLSGSFDGTVSGVSTDSRSVTADQLFVPLKGERFDGHDFLAAVAAKGVRIALAAASEMHNPALQGLRSMSLVFVTDTLQALGDLAAAYRRRFQIPVIGITGSNGKTTTKEMLAAILEQGEAGLKTQGNLNNLIGLPQMLFKLTPSHYWAVLEMGMSEPGEIDRLAEIAAPRTGVVLNAFPAHLESMGTVEGVARAKGELLLRLPADGAAVVNADDQLIAMQPMAAGTRRVTFGLGAADVTAGQIESLGVDGQRILLRLPDGQQQVHLSAFGRHNVYNALAAAAAAWSIGISLEQISKGLEAFRPYDKRFRLERAGELLLIDDSYNANPASMSAALETLAGIKGGRRAYVALGDMLELGSDQVELHRRLGAQAARVADRLYLCGPLAAHAAEAARLAGMDADAIICTSQHDEIVVDMVARAEAGDFILVKGSRGMHMEMVSEGIRCAMK